MTSKSDSYRAILAGIPDRESYLLANSNLPGPRGNLELLYAMMEEGTGEEFRRWAALGYCWSVAVVALPEAGKPLMEKWLNSADPDVLWIMRENLRKNRLVKMDPVWVRRLSTN
jgi:hypothetical protein